MSKVDVLNLEWVALPSRDRIMETLACNYLRIMVRALNNSIDFRF